MKKSILFIVILFVISIFVSGCNQNKTEQLDALDKIKQRDKLIVGIKYDSMPFGFIDKDQKVVGLDADLSRAIAKYLLGNENKVEFREVTPSNRILALNSGQVDVIIATMTITPQRREVVNFSKPYYVAGIGIMVFENSDIKRANDLNGRKVVVVLGTTADKSIRIMAPNAIVQGYRTYSDAYMALKNKRAEAIVTDDSILLGMAMNDSSVKILPSRYSKEPYGIAVKKSQDSQRLITEIDNAIEYMIQSGELEHLKKRWVKMK